MGRSHVDDEYARAGERDPKVLVTTSRDPTSRLGQFAKVCITCASSMWRLRGAAGTPSSIPKCAEDQ